MQLAHYVLASQGISCREAALPLHAAGRPSHAMQFLGCCVYQTRHLCAVLF